MSPVTRKRLPRMPLDGNLDLTHHMRYDGNARRNEEIGSERLSPAQIAAIEQADDERATALQHGCDKLIFPEHTGPVCNHLFHCGVGNRSFAVSCDGVFRPCPDLWHPDCIHDLREGTLAQAWHKLVPRVRDMRSGDAHFLEHCRRCPIPNLCMWCPAHAHLETGELDGFVSYFCEVAHARAEALTESMKGSRAEP